ncbi:hypothetical protein TNCV_3166481 [Trichonephila clavipes]|uniref:Mos1 transposase HTH domain-containing protein n=1 Tax=Trichonephila clavipes TaxID=2585209 RepID=A0A8X6RDZ3_TRICX|nr:hypothetical protein TNCV_3166481 [Trichonephila clavipes]
MEVGDWSRLGIPGWSCINRLIKVLLSVIIGNRSNSCAGENASQVAEIVNGLYSADTVTANYVQFWFRRFRSGIFDVKVSPRPSSKMLIELHK